MPTRSLSWSAAFVSLDRLRDPGCFRSWFYGTVLNVTRAWRRRQASRTFSLDELDDWDAAGPADVAAELELRWIVTDALRCLPEASRTVLVLFYYDGLSVLELAARLGVTPAAVKSRLHKGRGQLGRLLASDHPELGRRTAGRERTHVMTELRIASVVAFPARVLAVLADEQGQRALPAWLTPAEGPLLVSQAEGFPPRPARPGRRPQNWRPRSSPPRAGRYGPCGSAKLPACCPAR